MSLDLTGALGLLATYLRPQWRRSMLLGLLLVASAALQVLSPQIIRRFIDTATSGGAPEALATGALLFIGVALVHSASSKSGYPGRSTCARPARPTTPCADSSSTPASATTPAAGRGFAARSPGQ